MPISEVECARATIELPGGCNNMELLPGDILGEIFGLLKWRNWALSLALTCKRFLEIWASKPINYVNFKYDTDGCVEGYNFSLKEVTIYITYGDNNMFVISRWLNPLKDEWYLPYESFSTISNVFNKKNINVYIPLKNTKKSRLEYKFYTRFNNGETGLHYMDETSVEFYETQKRIIDCIKNTPVEDKFDYIFDRIAEIDIYGKPMHQLFDTNDSDTSSDNWSSDEEE